MNEFKITEEKDAIQKIVCEKIDTLKVYPLNSEETEMLMKLYLTEVLKDKPKDGDLPF